MLFLDLFSSLVKKGACSQRSSTSRWPGRQGGESKSVQQQQYLLLRATVLLDHLSDHKGSNVQYYVQDHERCRRRSPKREGASVISRRPTRVLEKWVCTPSSCTRALEVMKQEKALEVRRQQQHRQIQLFTGSAHGGAGGGGAAAGAPQPLRRRLPRASFSDSDPCCPVPAWPLL